ncbi:MAG: hypothetical protein QXK47_05615 [Candidatus Bathyarchaeia archaeon]
MKRTVALAICLLAMFALCALSSANAASFQSASLEVFADGVVHFKATIITNGTEASVTMPLLAPREHAYNVLATDEAGSALAYDVEGQNITIYSLDATQVTLEYDTDFLTSKSGGLWTLAFTSPFKVDVLFPKNSTIIYINAAPLSLRAKGDSVVLKLSPGSWEICYEVGVHPPAPQPPAPQPEPKQPGGGWP